MERIQSTYLFNPEVNAGKMIFLSGPRQVGKTFFVKERLRRISNDALYFNWDDPYVRREYTRNPHFLKVPLARAPGNPPLVAFDEIHKHKNWKNILKGLYDIHIGEAQIIVTGSARLDFFKASGDSLAGRYFSYRLLPMGLAEAMQDFSLAIDTPSIFSHPDAAGLPARLADDAKSSVCKEAFYVWLRFGGFPEPFIKARDTFSRKWRNTYRSLLVSEDLRDITRIHDLKGIEQLMLLLPERIGSPLSINSLREDLQVNHKTVSSWLDALVKIYLLFSIPPWSKSIAKAIAKERKFYFFDWTMVDDPGARFENAVAVSLLRLVNRWNELGLGDFDIRYVRNVHKQEVDFLLIDRNAPMALFEVKLNDSSLSPSGVFFADALKVPYYQIVAEAGRPEAFPKERYILPAWQFLGMLG
ncbi:MAG: ATP-binding protein [Chitinispirillaceae bacterium]|nr:ATP-binding protein [Chitinispirillaceae bacterium]